MGKYLNTISAFQFYQLVRYATLILIGVVFAKSQLAQSEIGEYETFIFLAGSVSFFWLNGLLKALLPLSAEKKNSTIFSAFLVIQFFSFLTVLVLLLSLPLFKEILLNGRNIPESGLLLLFIVFGAPSNLVEYYYLIQKRNKAIIYYGTVSYLVQFALVVVPVLLGYHIKSALFGLVLSTLLRYVWFWIIMIRHSEIHVSKTFIKEHLRLGTPLIVSTFLSGSAQFVDGFIVTSKFNEETFAVFRFGARELPLAMLLANALSNAMLTRFTSKENMESSLKQLKTSVTRLMHFLFPLTIILLVTSHHLFPIVFNSDFEESATIFNIYLLLIISRLLLPQTILNGLRITKPIMTASFLELIINVFFSLMFVKYWGITGIALATFIAFLFEKLYLSAIVKKKLKIPLSDYVPIRIYLLYSFVVIVIFIFVEIIF